MLANERQQKIIDIVTKKKSVSVRELTSSLQVSEITIRRDITQLDKEGLLNKVHGGAMSKQGIQEIDSDVNLRETMYRKEKETIAKYASSLIEDYDCIYLDAGSSVALMIPHIKAKGISIVTNSIDHAIQLTKRGITSYLLGGSIKISTDAIVGVDALRMLENYNFTKGFFGANGVSLTQGLTTPDRSEAEIKYRAIKQCSKAYLLFDATKYETVSAVRFGDVEEMHLISNQANENYKHLTNYDVVSL